MNGSGGDTKTYVRKFFFLYIKTKSNIWIISNKELL